MTTAATTTPALTTPAPPADGVRQGALGWFGTWRPILALALTLAAARLLYLAFVSPYTLIEDEAHYWEWSRRLDWSYYSKGPGIAYAIRAATELFGVSEFAVRLPAVVASFLATILVGLLAADVASRPPTPPAPLTAPRIPDWRIGFFAAACFQLAPLNQFIALLSTIDGPYLACWAAACWAAWRALERGSAWAWIGLGAAIGLGFLFKYTILLLPPSLLAYALLRRWSDVPLTLSRRWGRWLLAGSLLAVAGLAPVVVWNALHDWPTVRHLLGHLHLPAGDMPARTDPAHGWTPLWTLEFLGTQLGLVGPALILAAVATVWSVWTWWESAQRTRRAAPSARAAVADDDGHAELSGQLFLVCCAVPLLLFYLLVTLFTEAEGNWAMAAYITLLPLAGWYAADAMREYAAKLAAWRRFPPRLRPWSGYVRRRPEIPGQILWHATITYGLLAAVAMLRVDLVQAGVAHADAALARLGVQSRLAVAIPAGRLTGAREMGLHAAEILEQLAAEEQAEPFVIARHYGRASLLAFYIPGRPVVYCASSRTGGRPTQYDLWPDTSLDAATLLGRPALLVGHDESVWRRGFDEVREAGNLRGDPKRGTRPAYLGLRYNGLTAPAPPPSRRKEVAKAALPPPPPPRPLPSNPIYPPPVPLASEDAAP